MIFLHFSPNCSFPPGGSIAHLSSGDARHGEHVVVRTPGEIEAALDARGDVAGVQFYFGGFPRRATTREKARTLYTKIFRAFDPTPEQRAKNEARWAKERERRRAELDARYGPYDASHLTVNDF